MADFHILDQSDDGRVVHVVFHFAVPATNNQANISYQTAMVMHLGGAESITSKVANPTELANMQAGAVYEVQSSVRYSRLGLTNAQKLNEIKAAWTERKNELTTQFPIILAFEGYSGSVT